MKRVIFFSLALGLFACGDDDGDNGLDMSPAPDAGPADDAAPSCPDEVPDDTAETAKSLPDITSNAGFPIGEEQGDIDPLTDVDWIVYHDEDVISGDVEPRISLATRSESGGVWELCVYFECDSGVTSFACPVGSTPAMNGALQGCCVTSPEGSASITIEPACSDTSSEDGLVYGRVSRQGGVVDCGGYLLSYGDD